MSSDDCPQPLFKQKAPGYGRTPNASRCPMRAKRMECGVFRRFLLCLCSFVDKAVLPCRARCLMPPGFLPFCNEIRVSSVVCRGEETDVGPGSLLRLLALAVGRYSRSDDQPIVHRMVSHTRMSQSVDDDLSIRATYPKFVSRLLNSYDTSGSVRR